MQKVFHISKLGRHWAISLLAGFLVLLALLLAVTQNAVTMMKQDKIKEHWNSSKSMQHSIDRYLLTLKQLSVELLLNNQNMALQAAEDKSSFVDNASYQFSNLIYNIKAANPLVEDVYLYYPAQDYVVGSKGCYPSRAYYLLSNNLADRGYDDWVNNLLLTDQTGFFFFPSQTGELKLYLRQQLMPGNGTDSASLLLLYVDKLEFQHLLETMRPVDKSTTVAVFSIDGQLYQSDAEYDYDALQNVDVQTDSSYREIQTDDFIGWQSLSSHKSFYYVVVSELAVLLEEIAQIRRFLVFAILLCFCIGICFSFFLSWKHHAPIEKTVRKLDKVHDGKHMDYYEFEQRINTLISENENASQLNEKMLFALKRNVLQDILTQRLTDSVNIGLLLKSSGITLDYLYFDLLLADLSFEEDETQMLHWLCHATAMFEHEHSDTEIVTTIIHQTAVFLINYEISGQSYCERLQKIFAEECDQKPVYCESGEFLAIEQIAPLFEQIALQMHKQTGTAVIDEKADWIHNEQGRLSLERFRKMLQLQEYANAAEQLPPLMTSYVVSGDPYICMSRRYVIVDAVLQCVETEDQRKHTNFAPACLQRIKSCTGTSSLFDCLSKILAEMSNRENQYAMKRPDKLAHQIKKIIEDNYDQQYLGLYYIADQLKVGSSYVSKAFKNEYGIGIVEYVNRLRIDSAKRLLETQDLTIKEIAEKVGFASDIHFIRIFKKNEHTTPGVYKRNERS